jgi:hypothetical protein
MVHCMYRIDLLLGKWSFFLLAKGLMLRLLLWRHLFLGMWLVLGVCGSLGFPSLYFSMFLGSWWVTDLTCVKAEYVL